MKAGLFFVSVSFIMVGCRDFLLLLLSKYRAHKELQRLFKRVDDEYLALYKAESYGYMQRRQKRAADSPVPVGCDYEGIWYSHCAPQRLLHIIEIEHIKSLLGENPCRLCVFVCNMRAERIELCGSWSDERGTYYQELQLGLTMQNDGRTAIRFKYVGPTSHPFAKRVIVETSAWLKSVCEQAV